MTQEVISAGKYSHLRNFLAFIKSQKGEPTAAHEERIGNR